MVDSIMNYNLDPDEDFYSILGCSEMSTIEQIVTEYRKRALDHHPDKNPNNAESDDVFLKLQKAKDVLIDEKLRADYDQWRSSGLAVSYAKWSDMKDSVKTSMHWATKKQHEPMIDVGPSTSTNTSCQSNRSVAKAHRSFVDAHLIGNVSWRRESGNDLLRKFRNYEI